MSSSYWSKREAKALKKYAKAEAEYDKQIKKIYANQINAIENEINAFYVKYANKEGITIQQAKRRVTQLDIKEYEKKAKAYVELASKDRKKGSKTNANIYFSGKANEEMALYNLTMKVNRLEMLKARIGLEMVKGHAELEKLFNDKLTQRALDEFERQAGILGNTVSSNEKQASIIANASFRNATFSDRIWMYQDILKNDLSRLLQSGLIQGKNPRVLARDIRKKFDVSVSNAERLMRTELARVQIEAQKQSYEKNGFEKYEFIANGSCCDICGALDGKIFDVEKLMPGENAPPMHPNCRCSTAPYEDRADYEEWVQALKNGTQITYADFMKLKKLVSINKKRNSFEKAMIFENKHLQFGNNKVDLNFIKSNKYRRKFTQLTENTKVNDKIRKFASATLTRCSGTDKESLLVIDADTGYEIIRKVENKYDLGVFLSDEEIEKIKRYKGRIIGIHNHPTNLYPTGSDFIAAGYRGYDFGLVITHDGKVYKYSVGNKSVRSQTINARIDKYVKKAYTESDKRRAYKKALNELGKEYGILWEEL